jgi:RecA-family ATPase
MTDDHNVTRLHPRGSNRQNEVRARFRSGLIAASEFEGVPMPERQWIVPDYIPARNVTLLSGDGGIGKSLLALQLGMARALGREWVGLLPEPGQTLVLSAEDDREEMHRRLGLMRPFYDASWSQLGDLKINDVVGKGCVLGALNRGRIEATPMCCELDAYMAESALSLVILDVLAAMFAGNECQREQVRQFVDILNGLCRRHDCAILLLSHPSLTGINTGTGLSGSTDWNNGVRSRLYLRTPPASNDGSTPDKNLRTLEGMKANYGERGGKIDLEWKDGVFRRVKEPALLDKLAAEKKAEDVFMRLMKRFNSEGRNVSDKNGTSYAPAIFAAQPDAEGITSKQFKGAMDRLFVAKDIRLMNKGRPSKPAWTLVPADE